MNRKEKLKLKKDMKRKLRYRKRAIREAYMFRITNYMETVDYAIDCFMRECDKALM